MEQDILCASGKNRTEFQFSPLHFELPSSLKRFFLILGALIPAWELNLKHQLQ